MRRAATASRAPPAGAGRSARQPSQRQRAVAPSIQSGCFTPALGCFARARARARRRGAPRRASRARRTFCVCCDSVCSAAQLEPAAGASAAAVACSMSRPATWAPHSAGVDAQGNARASAHVGAARSVRLARGVCAAACVSGSAARRAAASKRLRLLAHTQTGSAPRASRSGAPWWRRTPAPPAAASWRAPWRRTCTRRGTAAAKLVTRNFARNLYRLCSSRRDGRKVPGPRRRAGPTRGAGCVRVRVR
jgi:hypothetical protein